MAAWLFIVFVCSAITIVWALLIPGGVVAVVPWLRHRVCVLAGAALSVLAFFIPPNLANANHNPPVGVYVGILGLTAATVSLFRLKSWEKFAWILFMTLLMVAEIRNLYVADRRQLKTFSDISQSLEKTKSGLDSSVAALQNLAGQITGDESYAILWYVPIQGFLSFNHIGNYPLYGVSARIANLDLIKTGDFGIAVPVGDMTPGHAYTRPIPADVPTSGDHFDANIFFSARNGDWVERLRVVKVENGWEVAVRVMGRFSSLGSEIPMCETITHNFPLKADGSIEKDWVPDSRLPRCR
jgi:hypothetical protein